MAGVLRSGRDESISQGAFGAPSSASLSNPLPCERHQGVPLDSLEAHGHMTEGEQAHGSFPMVLLADLGPAGLSYPNLLQPPSDTQQQRDRAR